MTFLWTGYVLTWVAVAGYAWRLERRRAEEERNLEYIREEGGTPRPERQPAS